MTKLHLLSDIHLEFEPFTLPETDADIVVLAGDTGSVKAKPNTTITHWARPDRPIVWVAGNHEFYGGEYPTTMNIFQENNNPNVHFLNNSEWISPQGIRFLGCTLWTDFALYGPPDFDEIQWWLNDYVKIKLPNGQVFKPQDALAAHLKSRHWLEKMLEEPFDGPTVVVTHHSPSPKSITKGHVANHMNPAYHSDLEYLMGPQVTLWHHGHTHASLDYVVNGTRVVSNAKGYPNERTGYDSRLVIEV